MTRSICLKAFFKISPASVDAKAQTLYFLAEIARR